MLTTSASHTHYRAGSRLRELTQENVFNHFHPKKARFYRPYFKKRMNLGNTTTNVVEAENRVLKYTEGGPRPCDPINEAYERIHDLQATIGHGEELQGGTEEQGTA